MKLVKKIVPVVLSLTLCASMVAPAFAASFQDLQDAINGTEDKEYGENGGITAVTGNDGVRNVTLNEKVEYGGEDDAAGITIDASKKVTLNLNGNTIDGGYDAETGEGGSGASLIYVNRYAELEINGGENSEDTEQRGALTGGNASASYGKPIWGCGGAIHAYGNVTVNNVDITGNHADTYGGAIAGYGAYNATVTLTNTNVTNNTAAVGGGISSVSSEGKTNTIYINNGSISDNTATGDGGGGIYAIDEDWGNGGSTVILNGVELNNNKAPDGCGGAMYLVSDNVTLTDTTMTGNTASVNGGAIVAVGSTVQLNGDISITGNETDEKGGGVFLLFDANTLEAGDGSTIVIRGNSAETAGDDIYAEEGSTLKLGDTAWRMDNAGERNANVAYETSEDGTVAESVGLKAGNVVTGSDTPSTTPATGSAGSGEAEVEIDEVDVPLAGLFTRADAIGYLWQQAGEPEWELSDFEDVPEDHQWAVAIGWAQDMGIAVADLDGNFRPDDLVLRSVEDIELSPEGELQEFLNRYAVYAGIELDADELFIELAGDWDDIIMGEDAQVIFDDFFAKLEAALSAAA